MTVDRVYNQTIGTQNVSANFSEVTGPKVSTLETQFGEILGGQLAGGTQMAGLFGVALMGYFLFKSDVNEDIAASVMVPAVFFFAREGLLPFGQGIIYAMILTTAAVAIFGIIKFADR